MADGLWTMNEDGSFELAEPYSSMLLEARVVATKAWTEALLSYLEPRCPYTWDQLKKELLRRNEERPEGAIETLRGLRLGSP